MIELLLALVMHVSGSGPAGINLGTARRPLIVPDTARYARVRTIVETMPFEATAFWHPERARRDTFGGYQSRFAFDYYTDRIVYHRVNVYTERLVPKQLNRNVLGAYDTTWRVIRSLSDRPTIGVPR